MSNTWLKRVCNNPLIIAFDRGSQCIMQILTAYYWFAKEYMANITLQWCAYIIYICILVLRLSSYTFQYIMLQKWVKVLMSSQILCIVIYLCTSMFICLNYTHCATYYWHLIWYMYWITVWYWPYVPWQISNMQSTSS